MATKKDPIVLMDEDLEPLLKDIKELRTGKRSLENMEKELMDKARPRLNVFREEFDGAKLQFGDVVVNPIVSNRKSISAERLLELGVDPEIIKKATVETEVVQYRLN